MPRFNLRLVAACALVTLAASGCGSDNPSSHPSRSATATPSTSATSSPTAAPSGPLGKQLQALQDRADQATSGQFSEVTRTIAGAEISSIHGRYSTDAQQIAATFKVPDTSSTQKATARLAIVGSDAFLQVDQWKKPSRGCWLKTTAAKLSQDYALDVADSDRVPLPVLLIDNFEPTGSPGKGLLQGKVDITAALPLLSGSIKQQLVAARPQGKVPAFLTFDAQQMLVTVPGYALSTALSNSLKIDESKFSTIAAARYEAGLTGLGGAFAKVTAPATRLQMSDADLKANRCG
jgi:hypothetical protein